MTRILLADAMDLVTRGARLVLQQEPGWTVVSECQSLADALAQLAAEPVDVIVCGEQIDPAHDTLSLTARLQAAAPCARIILIGSATDGRLIYDLLQSGVCAYLYRADRLGEDLLAALRAVLRASFYLSPTANAEYLVAMQVGIRPIPLDDEARIVLSLLAQGCTVGEIAARLKLPLRRVYWVRHKLRQRFDAATNEHLISCAAAAGYTHLAE